VHTIAVYIFVHVFIMCVTSQIYGATLATCWQRVIPRRKRYINMVIALRGIIMLIDINNNVINNNVKYLVLSDFK